ncbi:MAG: PilZ domain-containing protein [Acidobacteria bacterium]|nr:PilZ domain-containing protein [Acidobacteriota bacterium]
MLRSLLLSRDEGTVRLITRIFKDLDVEAQHFAESSEAIAKISNSRFDAIVVDDQVDDAHLVLEKAIEFPSCSKSVRIALAQPDVKMNAIFRTGTQVILYKPLSLERVRHGLRAVRNLMARDRRRGGERVQTMLPAKMTPRRGTSKDIVIVDLSDSGAAINLENGDLRATGSVGLDFVLPGNPERIHCTAELVWQDNQGNAGMRFVDMATFGRKQLCEWLKENAKNTKAAASRAGR